MHFLITATAKEKVLLRKVYNKKHFSPPPLTIYDACNTTPPCGGTTLAPVSSLAAAASTSSIQTSMAGWVNLFVNSVTRRYY